jgi:uncharacterized protein
LLDVDLRAVARQGQPLQGQLPLGCFARLLEGLPAWEEAASAEAPPLPGQVTWSAWAESRTPLGGQAQWWLHVQLEAQVPQTCQRCMAAYLQQVAVDRWFRFVADEATALAEDDACEEVLLVWAQPGLIIRLRNGLLGLSPAASVFDTGRFAVASAIDGPRSRS